MNTIPVTVQTFDSFKAAVPSFASEAILIVGVNLKAFASMGALVTTTPAQIDVFVFTDASVFHQAANVLLAEIARRLDSTEKHVSAAANN